MQGSKAGILVVLGILLIGMNVCLAQLGIEKTTDGYGPSELLGEGDQDNTQYITPRGLQTNYTVFGFLPYWISSSYEPDWDRLTHISYFGIELNQDGTIKSLHGWPNNTLTQIAQANGVKMILSVIILTSSEVNTLLGSPTYTQTAINTIIAQVQVANPDPDGVIIDFEFPSGANRDAFSGFMQTLSESLKSNNSDFWIGACPPSIDWGNAFDWANLSASCDGLFIMAYGFHYGGSSNTGAIAQLGGGTYNIQWGVNNFKSEGGDPKRYILGLPWYGYKWSSASDQAYASTAGYSDSFFHYEAISEQQGKTRNWDSVQVSPWYSYYSGGSWYQVWYDDSESLGIKLDYIVDESLGGYGIWALGYESSSDDLWTQIEEKLQDLPPEISQTSYNTAVPENGTNWVNWTLQDDRGSGWHRVLRNDTTIFDWSEWDNSTTISVPINTNIGLGQWKYTIEYNDSIGTPGINNSVLITILPNQPPTVSFRPSNVVNMEESANYNLNWVLTDDVGSGQYRVLINGSLWIDWTPWVNGSSINVPVNMSGGLGTWNYTLQYTDQYGELGLQEVVLVIVSEQSQDSGDDLIDSSSLFVIAIIVSTAGILIVGAFGFMRKDKRHVEPVRAPDVSVHSPDFIEIQFDQLDAFIKRGEVLLEETNHRGAVKVFEQALKISIELLHDGYDAQVLNAIIKYINTQKSICESLGGGW